MKYFKITVIGSFFRSFISVFQWAVASEIVRYN